MRIGEKIMYARKAKGLTQTKLAEQIGVSKNAICLLENGKNKPAPQTVVKLSAALDVPVEMLSEDSVSKEMQEIILARSKTMSVPELIARLRLLDISDDKIAKILELVCDK